MDRTIRFPASPSAPGHYMTSSLCFQSNHVILEAQRTLFYGDCLVVTTKILKSKWFWIFIGICVAEEATFFFPFLSLFLLAAAILPKFAMRFAIIFVEYYNDVYGTDYVIGLKQTNSG